MARLFARNPCLTVIDSLILAAVARLFRGQSLASGKDGRFGPVFPANREFAGNFDRFCPLWAAERDFDFKIVSQSQWVM
jgi:hypothetical protein